MNTDEQIRRAQENFRTITELRGKLEILTEHVESRKESLEEEIEEQLNEAIRNARDSLERIQENIEPKLENIIREKLEVIQKKMDRVTGEGIDAVRREIDAQTPVLTQKVLEEVDGLVASKLIAARDELSKSVDQKLQTAVQTALSDYKKKTETDLIRLRVIGFAALGLALAALGVVLK